MFAAYVVKHVSLCLLVHEWACGFWPRHRSKDSDEAGIHASFDVRRACALMVFIKQKAIEHIIYPIALWAYPGTVPISRKKEGNEDSARVCLVGISAVRVRMPSDRGPSLLYLRGGFYPVSIVQMRKSIARFSCTGSR